jgi:hypothetical protein
VQEAHKRRMQGHAPGAQRAAGANLTGSSSSAWEEVLPVAAGAGLGATGSRGNSAVEEAAGAEAAPLDAADLTFLQGLGFTRAQVCRWLQAVFQ